MYGFPKKDRAKDGPVTIERRTEVELEKAITDLEKRGYTLIRKGTSNQQDEAYQQLRTEQLTANLKSSRIRTLDPVDVVRCFAVMRKLSC